MHEATQDLTYSSAATGELAAAAACAETWAGEPFIHPGEDVEAVLTEGTARRRALDDALAEIDAGRRTPSPRWKVRYDDSTGGIVTRYFHTKLGCRRYARRLGRASAFLD